jgi:hypothetical protein
MTIGCEMRSHRCSTQNSGVIGSSPWFGAHEDAFLYPWRFSVFRGASCSVKFRDPIARSGKRSHHYELESQCNEIK